MALVTIRCQCEGGHVSTFQMDGIRPREWFLAYCKLLDGTSEMYLSKPADDSASTIGKCCYPKCGKPFRASIFKFDDSNDEKVPPASQG